MLFTNEPFLSFKKGGGAIDCLKIQQQKTIEV